MKSLLFTLGLVCMSLIVSAQITSEQIIAKADQETIQFEKSVVGDIPALALNQEQKARIQQIFLDKNNNRTEIDHTKVGKLKASQMMKALQAEALEEATKVLTLEQKINYKKNTSQED